MKIYSPQRNALLSQGYGVEGTKASMLAFYQSIGLKAHNGFDFAMTHGTPIYWIGSGKGRVYKICDDQKLGVGVFIISDGFRHRFWHGVLGSIKVKVGQMIDSGELLMYADNTGMSTGDHLHYDLAEVDKDEQVINGDNGYFGCIDPTPYYINIFIKDFIQTLQQQISILQQMINLWKQIKW